MVELIVEIVLLVAYVIASALYINKTVKKGEIVLIVLMAISLGVLVFFQYRNRFYYGIENIRFMTAAAVCFPLAWVDFLQKKIPNKVLLVVLIIRIPIILAELVTDADGLLDCLKEYGIALLFVAVFSGIALIAFKDGIGMGDVKLILILALYLGSKGIFSMMFFALLAAFFAALYLLLIKKAGRKASIPFAPAILLGTYVTVLLYAFEVG